MSEQNPSLAELMGDKPAAPETTAEAKTKPARAAKPKDADEPLVTDDEIAAARAEAQRRVREAEKAAALARIIEEEEYRLKREQGQRTGVVDKDEQVSIHIDLAEFSDKIMLNGVQYWHGYTYEVPRHVADTLREIMQRTHRHQMEIDGKSLDEMYRRTAPVALSPAGQRPFAGEIAA